MILPVPYYFNHHMWLEMLKIEPRYLPAIGNGSVYPRASDAERLIDARTRAIVLCSPNNPTGAIYPPAIIDEFFALARQHSLALVIDETYKDFRDSSGPPHDLFSHPEWSGTFVQLYSFSKVFALTGYRVGSIIAAANFSPSSRRFSTALPFARPISPKAPPCSASRHWRNGKRRNCK